MSPEPQVPREDARPGLSEPARLTGVLFDPQRAFQDIAARPRWWPPLVLVIALTMVYMASISSRVGWEPIVRQQMESSSRIQSLPPEQRERAIEQGTRFASYSAFGGALLGMPIMTLAIAGALLLIFRLAASAEISFKQSFAVTCYSWMAQFVSAILALVVLFLKRPEDFNIQNPLAFNIGAFLDPNGTPKWLLSLATSLDLFSIWTVVLLGIGMAAAARKLAVSKAVTLVAVLWVVWILLKSGSAAVFS